MQLYSLRKYKDVIRVFVLYYNHLKGERFKLPMLLSTYFKAINKVIYPHKTTLIYQHYYLMSYKNIK
jgi:hypothetical protein